MVNTCGTSENDRRLHHDFSPFGEKGMMMIADAVAKDLRSHTKTKIFLLVDSVISSLLRWWWL